jgi:probable HAF family extracellular repeat protein
MKVPRQTGKGNPRCALMGAAFAFAALFIAPLGDRVAFGQCSYEVTAIVAGPPCGPSGNPTPLIPRGMNLHGEIVGSYRDCLVPSRDHAFYWSPDAPGQLITLPTPPWAMSSFANDINDNGIIAGVHRLPDGLTYVGFVYDIKANNGEYIYLPTKHGVGTSHANALNNAGVVAGSRSIGKSGINPYNAVIWRPFEKGAPVEDLGLMDVGPNSSARAINSNNEVSGWSGPALPPGQWAFLVANDEQHVGMIPNGTTTDARGINDRTYVVGGGLIVMDGGTSSARGFIWSDRSFLLIDPLPGFSSSSASAINDVGQVAGASSSPGGPTRALLWQNGVTLDLNELTEGVVLLSAPDINNAGQILVRAQNSRGALLTPVDVPLGDLNYDCRVNYHDLLIMFEQWGPVARNRGADSGPSADLNGDGVVNVTDLLILFDHWTN